VAGVLSGFPVWNKQDILPFVEKPMAAVPQAAPSIVNAKELGLKLVPDA
jgi:hydroxypyruvate reductase 1